MIAKEELKKIVSSRMPPGRFKNLLRAIYHQVINSPENIKFDKKNNCYIIHLNGVVPPTNIRMPKKPFGILHIPQHEMSGYFSIPFLPNSTIIDAGAFPGDYATIAATHAKDSRIISLEPDPLNNKYTQKVLSLNDISNNVELLECALSDKAELVNFIQKYASSRITNNSDSPLCKTITVNTTTLDKILEERNLFNGRPVYVKMDIEAQRFRHIKECYKQ